MDPHVKQPAIIQSAGNKPKLIKEFIGIINADSKDISIARMKSPSGWEEPAQRPEFDEYTFVLRGEVHVETQGKIYKVKENEVFMPKRVLLFAIPHPLRGVPNI